MRVGFGEDGGRAETLRARWGAGTAYVSPPIAYQKLPMRASTLRSLAYGFASVGLACLSIGVTGCGNGDAAAVPVDETAGLEPLQLEALPADFPAFYERFHRDSAFQVEHTSWPLPGLLVRDEATGRIDETYHELETWRMHRRLERGGGFEQAFTPVDESLVFETIAHPGTGYRIERRWARLGRDWQLIFYRTGR